MNLGTVRDYDELVRRLLVTAAVFIAYRLGTQLPLPGLAPDALSQLRGLAHDHISILALGITPYVTVLILVELVKVLAPRLRGWELAQPRNGMMLGRIVLVLSLLAAAAQASGLALAFEDVPNLVEEPGTPFRLVCIMTLVAGSALVIWLADLITREGLGSGVWLMLASAWIARLPDQTAASLSRAPAALSVLELVIGWGLAAALLAALVAVIRAGSSTRQTAPTCLWTRLLAEAVWPWLILILGGLTGMGSYLASPVNPIALVALMGLIVLFTHFYARSLQRAQQPVPPMPSSLLGGVLALVAVAVWIFPFGYAMPLAGHLVLTAAVALTILERWWVAPFPVRPDTTTPGA